VSWTHLRSARRYATQPEVAKDLAFSNYHALTQVPAEAVAALTTPGATSWKFTSSELSALSAARREHEWIDSILPERPADGPKAKPFENPLPQLEGGIETCGWQATAFTVEVTFTTPIVPPWKPPPKPSKPLHEVLPKCVTPEPEEGPTATEKFRSIVTGA
jgi:hypothetical protein